jgi:hypothetical protein
MSDESHGRVLREEDPFRWALSGIWRLIRKLAKNPLGATAAISAYLVVKVLIVSQGDVTTALAVLQTAGLASAIQGSLLSAIGILASGVVAFTVGRALWFMTHAIPRSHMSHELTALSWLVAALLIGGLVTAWTVLLASVIVGIVSWGVVQTLADIPHPDTVSKRIFSRAIALPITLAIVAAVFAGSAVYAVAYAMWLPHEVVVDPTFHVVNPNYQADPEIIGYVLDDGNGWLSVLEHNKRDVLRLPSGDVTSRTVCRIGTTFPLREPTAWEWLSRLLHLPGAQPKSYTCTMVKATLAKNGAGTVNPVGAKGLEPLTPSL